MADLFGTFLDNIVFTNADTLKAIQNANGDSHRYYRIPVQYLSIVECKQECHIYSNDSKTNLVAHILPNTEATYYLGPPTNTLIFSWGDINERALPQDTMLWAYATQFPPDRNVQKGGPLATLFRNSNPATVPIEIIMDMSSPVIGAALGLMVESDFIVNDLTLNTFALNNAAGEPLSPQQLLAVAPYIRSTGLAWDGSVAVTGTVDTKSHSRNNFTVSDASHTVAFVAATPVMIATLFKLSGTGFTTRVSDIEIAIFSNTVASIIELDVFRLNANSTGGTVIPETPWTNVVSAASEYRDRPATSGAVGQPMRTFWSLGATGVASVANPPPVIPWVSCIPPVAKDADGLMMTNSVDRGYGLRLTSSANSTIVYAVRYTWSEE